ncbi:MULTISPECIES: phage major capsid protein [unclassified Aerococcus]|uniref:phage major capsid protein n=1 Tax=unclassified Aerococcus TaxID=2618060 RepID=UPI0025C4DCB1|nr:MULTISPECIES: phage major capsid protein [unclassified Aerococcus]
MFKLKSMTNFASKREEFINAVKEGADQEAQGDAYLNMINALAEDVMDEAKKEVNLQVDQAANINKAKMSKETYQFFNEINTEVGYKEEKLLPETTIDEIFEDLTTEHPLLDAIGLKSAGIRLKFLRSETSGQAVWGKVFDEIKGQLDAAFSDEVAIQNKLTAFVVVPKDLTDLSVNWIERFVRLQIIEAFAVALEAAFLSGDGNDKPIGLNRDIDNGTVSGGVTTYPVKTAQGTLSFADTDSIIQEFKDIKKHHSTKSNGQAINTAGQLYLVVSSEDKADIEAKFTILNANGVYVNAVPFNINIVESVFQEKGTAVSFVKSRYDAYIGGGITLRKFDQTFALEDLDLYTAKQFAYGKAKDGKATAVWTLAEPATLPEG